MTSRYKTFAEFTSAIKIVYRSNNGVKIFCMVKGKEYVILETGYRPWNSEQTRKRFIIRLYIREILSKHNMNKRITRIEGFELLGHRCLYLDQLHIICSSEDFVNTETGEVTKKLLIVNAATNDRPTKVFINQVQI